MNREDGENLMCLGWREWLSFPELNIPFIKAKVDTGARTSALHTFALETFNESGKLMVRFNLHPLQNRDDVLIQSTAEVIDERWVTDSGGHREQRFVISTPIRIGDREWPIEVTLTNRDTMKFRMLLGRSAMKGNFVVRPDASYLFGRRKKKELKAIYSV